MSLIDAMREDPDLCGGRSVVGSPNRSSSRSVNLAPQSLLPNETISSMVDRQAQIWGVLRKDLVCQTVPAISGALALKDLDVCRSGDFLDIYAQKTGIDRHLLEKHRADRSKALVHPSSRDAYCPMCFHDDASAGNALYFRLDWARIFLTHCRVHGCPLFRWLRVSTDGTRRLPLKWCTNGLETLLIPQFQQDLRLARGYAYGIRPRTLASEEAWKTLKRFETWLYDLGVGSPNYRTLHQQGRSIESEVMEHAVVLSRDAISDGRPRLPKQEAMFFENQRVMRFTFKKCDGYVTHPTWQNLREAIRFIACRRGVLYRVSTLMHWRYASDFVLQIEGTDRDRRIFGT